LTIEEQLQQISENLNTLTRIHLGNDREYRERFVANEKRLAQLMDTMNRLGRILEIHDQRLDDHEQRLDDLGKQ
jgi:hypothetical protein